MKKTKKNMKGGLKSKFKKYKTECLFKDDKKDIVICNVEVKSSIDKISNYSENSSVSFNNKNPLSIKIDDFTFVIKNKFTGDDGRIKIYYSVNNFNYFTYKSNSDVNWRFGMMQHDNVYNKGRDYITTTQIHQSLQCFINKIYDKIPLLENEDTNNENNNFKKPEEILIPLEDLLEKTKKKTTKTRKISKKVLYNPDEFPKINERILKNDVFIPMYKTCNPGFCFIENKMIEIFGKDYDFGKKSDRQTNINYETKYFNYMNDLLKKVTISFEDFIDKYYNLIVSIFSQYMENFFKLSDTNNSKFICNVNIDVPYSRECNLKQTLIVSIYKINIELKDDLKQKFTLIYGKYDYKHYNQITETIEEEKRAYKIILNLIPFNCKINKFGLYEHYISSGIYVYKMFDYHHPRVLQVEYEANKLPGYYTFIGDLLNNMYPLPILQEPKINKIIKN